MNACPPRSFGALADREGGVRAAPVSMGVMTAICRTGAESTVFKPEQHGAVLQKFWLKYLRQMPAFAGNRQAEKRQIYWRRSPVCRSGQNRLSPRYLSWGAIKHFSIGFQ